MAQGYQEVDELDKVIYKPNIYPARVHAAKASWREQTRNKKDSVLSAFFKRSS